MEELEEAVNNLLRVRDTWVFENTQLTFDSLTEDPVKIFNQGTDFLITLIREVVQESEEKSGKLAAHVNEVITLVNRALSDSSDSLSPTQKAKILLLKGKALNVMVPPAQEAKATLEKAIELDPGLADAWCELAEYEWMTNGPEAALVPLHRALQINVSR